MFVLRITDSIRHGRVRITFVIYNKYFALKYSWFKSTVKSCADLNPVANGIYSPSTGPYTEYDEVTFTCDAGYYLSAGDSLITCIEKAWINENTGDAQIVPTCLGML